MIYLCLSKSYYNFYVYIKRHRLNHKKLRDRQCIALQKRCADSRVQSPSRPLSFHRPQTSEPRRDDDDD